MDPSPSRLKTQVDRSTPTGDLIFRLAEALSVSLALPDRLQSSSTMRFLNSHMISCPLNFI
jgi:hypothetical protein